MVGAGIDLQSIPVLQYNTGRLHDCLRESLTALESNTP